MPGRGKFQPAPRVIALGRSGNPATLLEIVACRAISGGDRLFGGVAFCLIRVTQEPETQVRAFQPYAPEGLDAPAEGRRIEVRGTVQGVGFRPWVYRLASETAITGRVRNHTGGVTIEAFGAHDAMERFVDRLATAAPPAAVIDRLDTKPIPFEPVTRFEIVDSTRQPERRVAIPPDLSTCPDCLAELRDPADRRFNYAFTNCTACGPRFTIALSSPYDRPNTTMVPFRMCPSCQSEYDEVGDRRFHAQPNACPECGPRLFMLDRRGAVEAGAVIDRAASALVKGLIVAVKGIGGFHLACDATSAVAIERLRLLKRRDEKPFAVMARDLADAQRLAVMSPVEQTLLTSVERPIVLVERREPSTLASCVAPRNPLVGLMLPYSPLHHLLLDRVGRPLVMTSGNLSNEPIVFTNGEALTQLSTVADAIVLHDREIVTGCDDSVARVIAEQPIVLRRSRGYVPRPIALARPVARPILGCGALLKNTFCLTRGDEACFGPHMGDLESVETYSAYQRAIERMEQFLGVEPEMVAHDLHPDYLSTRYALSRRGTLAVAVQHHHAHAASVMAEHGLQGPVIAVVYDGTGLGTDGTAWGGELLVADTRTFERVATFRPLALAGGDTAIRQPWRTALALVDDAFEGEAPIDALRLFRRVPAAQIAVVRRMIRAPLNSPVAHGVGRYFDAFGALGLDRPSASFEGQVALEWDAVADPAERGRFRYEIDRSRSPWHLDLRHAVRDAVFELIGGEPAARLSGRFHNTLAAATVDLVRGIARTHGKLPVVLSGGCFQNARLAEGVLHELSPDFKVYMHGQVPPGDGGIALGQAIVADALTRGR